MAPVQIKQAVTWLLETGAFADGDLDIKARTFNKQKPFCHQIFKDLIHNQWYGCKGEGVHYPEHFKGIPLALLAITTAAIECSLRGYVNGIDEDQMKDKDFGIDFEALEDTIIAQAA
ncbi:hypothetical protein SERLADRAFT_405883 [Serpula lacrymans var. lacrymans S7.9]|uniref:DUF6532 domain-containing protein n=1 Tax=Serpula lacrymans var. lacrymans (strain S7.9) TaxID=578457 RepID=F8NJR1_SERL9|nr:uncharacterized protein SERLADRAFT_405883 [Serpula lacrymans var. lacrymans S7.9]EGO28276.1 hypothetical protein SERLADRAFT_405883 [Serpula lacrymans var. lacrymans S7.9]